MKLPAEDEIAMAEVTGSTRLFHGAVVGLRGAGRRGEYESVSGHPPIGEEKRCHLRSL